MKEKNKENVKMNLTLKKEFFELIKEKAEKDHLKTATWVKQFLIRNLERDYCQKSGNV